jgi:hypothetical protein
LGISLLLRHGLGQTRELPYIMRCPDVLNGPRNLFPMLSTGHSLQLLDQFLIGPVEKPEKVGAG